MTQYHIMVVDDEKDLVAISARLLKHHGYQVSGYYDGPTALVAIKHERPDAILLDIGMSPMAGYEVCRRLRAAPWGQTIAVIALTGYGNKEDIDRAYAVGFDAHVVKPAALEQLVKMLPEWINSRRTT
ncbi:MAG: hypothetical protein JWP57_4227 [Spirosoma sp.]|nr:hypothetical protein [Spirosoma sp.]